MIAIGGFGRLPDELEKGRDERLASLERGLEHLKAGLGLLGVKPCRCCGIYYRRSDSGSLFDGGQLVCFDCVPKWWERRSPELSVKDRQTVERELRRWLVSHHHGAVIGKSSDLPRPERLLMKLVTGCEQCQGTGKTHQGGRCHPCDGRGTVWVVVHAPGFGPSFE